MFAFDQNCAIEFPDGYRNGVVGQLFHELPGMTHSPLSSFLLYSSPIYFGRIE